MKTFKTPKGTDLPMLNLRGKDYLQVAHRLVWFREERPDWQIKTTVTPDFESNRCISRAEISMPNGILIASATKVEDAKGFADYVEKSETGAIGRALALCGYGTQFAPEFDEESRIVDAPLERAASKIPQGTGAVAQSWKPGKAEHDAILAMCSSSKVDPKEVAHWIATQLKKEKLSELTEAQYFSLLEWINAEHDRRLK